MSLPTFFIVGAQKSGTTALYTYLRHHPQIFMSPIKEPQFFSPDLQVGGSGPGDRRSDRFRNLEDYRRLFADAGPEHGARGEGSVSYLYSRVAARRIAELVPDARVIAILRNPAERAHSNFRYLRREGREPLADFAEALEAEDERRRMGWSANWHYRAKGFYGEQVARYLDVLPLERLRLYPYETFRDRPEQVLRDIYAFLGVDPSFRQPLGLQVNQSGELRSRTLQRAFLRLRPLKWALEPILPTAVQSRLLALQNTNLVRAPLARDLRASLMEGYREDMTRLHELTNFDAEPWLRAAGSARRPAVASS